MALGAQNYISENYERVLRGPKDILGRSEKVPLDLNTFLVDLKGSKEPSKLESLTSLTERGGGGTGTS